RVAPQVDLYAGVDPSAHAVRANTAWAKEQGLFVDLVEGFADQVADLLPGVFDTAVLSGAVGHLPDLRYLRTALDALATVVRPGGTVVLADLIPPGAAPAPDLLTFPPELVAALAGPAWSAEVHLRDGVAGLPAELAQ